MKYTKSDPLKALTKVFNGNYKWLCVFYFISIDIVDPAKTSSIKLLSFNQVVIIDIVDPA